jgi:Sensors of blue-light using FAD
MLERLVYRSQATHKLGSLHLFNLLQQCRKRNRELGITGHLLYTEEIFVQCIEGPPAALDTLWHSLQRDERHHSLELLSRSPETHRRFADWSMAFSSYAHFNKYDIPGFFPVDAEGMSSAAERCAQWENQSMLTESR